MVGLIQKLLLDLVEEQAGAEAVSEVRRRADVPPDRVFRISETYSDEEWRRLFRAACEVLGSNEEQVLEAYAEAFGRDALSRFPRWFEMSKSSREFLERQATIHNVFASGLRDPAARKAVADKFRIERREREIVTHYHSPNRLCPLYKSLARWMFRHYGDEATIEEPKCMLRGDDECELHVVWTRMGAGADESRE
jgi:hypothetical protein